MEKCIYGIFFWPRPTVGYMFTEWHNTENPIFICQPELWMCRSIKRQIISSWAFNAFSYCTHLPLRAKSKPQLNLLNHSFLFSLPAEVPVRALRQRQGKYPGSTARASALQEEDKAVLFSLPDITSSPSQLGNLRLILIDAKPLLLFVLCQ